jgi:hypothetical protein
LVANVNNVNSNNTDSNKYENCQACINKDMFIGNNPIILYKLNTFVSFIHFNMKNDSEYINLYGCWRKSLQFVFNWNFNLRIQILNVLVNKQFNLWFASNFKIFNSSEESPILLPKLTYCLHSIDGPSTYTPHNYKLTYYSENEEKFPVIKQLRIEIELLLNKKFNFTQIILYSNENNHIKKHCDKEQVNGISKILYEEGIECIASYCVLGTSLVSFTDNRTNEKFTFVHKEGMIYIMNGCQRIGFHEKKKSINQLKFEQLFANLPQSMIKSSHISIIFRLLTLETNKQSKMKSININVDWNQNQQAIVHPQKIKTRYFQLIDEEPIGTIWNNRTEMYLNAAHCCSISGIDSENELAISIVENNGRSNIWLTSNNLIYCGHGSHTMKLISYNKFLVNSALNEIGIRVYVGFNSKYYDKPKFGFKLINLMFVNEFKIEFFQNVLVNFDLL